MGIVLVLRLVSSVSVIAVRYGMVRYRGPPLEIREYGTARYGTIGSCRDSRAAALHVSSLDLPEGLRTPTCI